MGASVLLYALTPILLAWLAAKPVHRYFNPPSAAEQVAAEEGYGPITLRLRLPGIYSLTPEPLLICGVPGRATLTYIKFYENSLAKIGVEFWGNVAAESELFQIPYGNNAQIDVKFYLPVLYPADGNQDWKRFSADEQEARRDHFEIQVDGVTRLKGHVHYEQPLGAPKYFGVNPVGGSLVSDRFVGTVIDVRRGE